MMSKIDEAPPTYDQVMAESYRRSSIRRNASSHNFFSDQNLPSVPEMSRSNAMKLLVHHGNVRGLKGLTKKNLTVTEVKAGAILRMTRTVYSKEQKNVCLTRQMSDSSLNGGEGLVSEGLIKCDKCDGNGKHFCSHCQGSMFKICYNCQGDGIEYVQEDNTSQTCLICSGCGKVNCQFCNLLPSSECKKCEGQGRLRQCKVVKNYTQKRSKYYFDHDERRVPAKVLEESTGIPVPGRSKTILENRKNLPKFIKEVVRVDLVPIYDVTLTQDMTVNHQFWMVGKENYIHFPQLSLMKNHSSSCSIM